MYTIDGPGYGLRIRLSGLVRRDEMARCMADGHRVLVGRSRFGVFWDLRELKPLPPDAQEELKRGQLQFRARGMERSMVVFDDRLVSMQYRRLARETGINATERYLVATTTPDWEVVGLAWLECGVDPDWKYAANRTSV